MMTAQTIEILKKVKTNKRISKEESSEREIQNHQISKVEVEATNRQLANSPLEPNRSGREECPIG